MLCAHPIDLDEVSPNAAFATCRVRRLAARRVIAVLRSALVPSVLMPALMLGFGCYALLTLTGSGPRSWQAQICVDGTLDLSACRAGSAGPSAVRTIAGTPR